MSVYRKIRIMFLGPDKELRDAPAEPPLSIMSEEERQRIKNDLIARAEREAR